MTMTTIANTTIMTSIDFLNTIINPAREAANEKPVRNNDFLSRVVDELDLDESLATKFSQPKLTGRGGNRNPVPYVELDMEQMMMVGMRESKAVRKAVLAKLKELEAENQMMGQALTEITQTETLEAAHGIAEEVLARRNLLRKSYSGEVAETLSVAFENRTSGGGRNIGQVRTNFGKLFSEVATGVTPCVFKKDHDGMNPRDWALANNDIELLEALTRAEAMVLALAKVGMNYKQIQAALVPSKK